MTDATREALMTSLASAYTIDREVGAGGMATVFLAEDVKHHRKVAIKVQVQSPAKIYVTTKQPDGKWSTPRQVATGGRARCSPDGKLLALADARGVAVTPVDAPAQRLLVADSSLFTTSVQWSAEGSAIYFKRYDRLGVSTIEAVSVRGGPPRTLARFADPARPSLRGDFTVSATHLHFPIQDRQSSVWLADLAK